jgi:hypothetical protein
LREQKTRITPRLWERRERIHTCEQEGVDVLTVVAACHVLLAEANRVFALGDAVKGLELFLGDTLQNGRWSEPHVLCSSVCQQVSTHPLRKVHFHCEDADVLGTDIDVVGATVERDGHRLWKEEEKEKVWVWVMCQGRGMKESQREDARWLNK